VGRGRGCAEDETGDYRRGGGGGEGDKVVCGYPLCDVKTASDVFVFVVTISLCLSLTDDRIIVEPVLLPALNTITCLGPSISTATGLFGDDHLQVVFCTGV
jgi:hypothetical protein